MDTITEIRQWLQTLPIADMRAMAERLGLSEYTLQKIRYGKRKQCRYTTVEALLQEKQRSEREAA